MLTQDKFNCFYKTCIFKSFYTHFTDSKAWKQGKRAFQLALNYVFLDVRPFVNHPKLHLLVAYKDSDYYP